MTLRLGKSFDSTKTVKNLVRGYKFAPHVDRYLQTWDEEGFEFKSAAKPPDLAWHPSSHCTPSLNELYWYAVEGHKEERKLSPAQVKNFQVGHFWHQWLQWVTVEGLGFASWDRVERQSLRGWGEKTTLINGPPGWGKIDLHSEYAQWQPFHWVTGSGDIAPADLPIYGEYLIDFKTMNAQGFKLNEPPPWMDTPAKWECQVNIYMDFFDLEKALIVGICKDTPHDLKEFEYHRNQPLIDAIYEKWELVSDCLDNDVVPPEDEEFELPLKGTV
jgi:hypothetical protein